MSRSSLAVVAATVLASLVFAGTPFAQPYPNKRVTLVVPFDPGGPTDIVSRAVMTEAEKKWGQPVVIENRPGASGLIGSAYVSRQPADGYTLLFHGNTPWTAHFFFKEVPFTQSDLKPLVAFGGSSYLMVTHPSVGAKTLGELFAMAKSKPKELNYATIQLTSYELDHYLLFRIPGVELTPVPFASAAPIIPGLLRGEIHVYMGIVSLVAQHVNAGKLVAVGYMGESRHPLFPNVPTSREQGIDFSTGFVLGVIGHSKIPDAVTQKIGRDLEEAVRLPEVGERLGKVGYQVYPAPLEWNRRIERELKNYTEVVRALNYQPRN